jgi:molecular chaperone GrpE
MDTEEKEQNTEEIINQDPDYKDMYVRLYADMENLKKRLAKEKNDSVEKTKIKMIESILDMDNDISIALKNMSGDIPEGVNLIVKKLKNFLKSQGIEEILVDKYDSDIHEVISVIETGEEKIVEVVSNGYRMGDKIIRFPKIIISK